MAEEITEWPPPGLDTTVPSTARVYDAILGGRDNFKVDREAAEVFSRHIPQARECAEDNRTALVRGVEYLVRGAGVGQLLDVGCGLPTGKNTHEAAQDIDPGARVVYVDKDPMVLTHGRALLADNDTTTVVTADLLDPEGITDHPEIRSFLDFDRPIGLMIIGMIMQIPDGRRPDDLIARLMEPLPSGSHLFITAWPDTGEPAQHALSKACVETLGSGWCRPVDQIERHFNGMELVPPGLDYIARWFPEEPDRPVPEVEELPPHQRTQMAAIARKA
ncbi:SAM-dependent methyltransferase [Glycomyces xiaoerkulensis]|uniref:SAM-dependent methyltransferase n=1 Tax=Glycomyces xiaoerkulensis TaxID=2038139 RepID=UPI000C26B150|nr:SAM-dependent methyltransferase [Glycomyces xiaoerkulensis]